MNQFCYILQLYTTIHNGLHQVLKKQTLLPQHSLEEHNTESSSGSPSTTKQLYNVHASGPMLQWDLHRVNRGRMSFEGERRGIVVEGFEETFQLCGAKQVISHFRPSMQWD